MKYTVQFKICFSKDTATTEKYSYCHTRSRHDARPISRRGPPGYDYQLSFRRSRTHGGRCHQPTVSRFARPARRGARLQLGNRCPLFTRSEEHTSELQSLMRISYAVFCLKKKRKLISSHFVPGYV